MNLNAIELGERIEFERRAMSESLRRAEYDLFIRQEANFYSKIIKCIETAIHYERCYSALEDLGARYGDILASNISQIPKRSDTFKVCYLLPNIDNDLAHIEFLYHVLKFHSPASGLQITVAGYSVDNRPPRSAYLSRLASERRISWIKIPDSHAGRVSFLRFFLEHGFSQLIVYSVPIQLGSWIRALGPSMVTWVTTKFELSAFKELKNRVSFSGSVVSQTEPKTKWRRSTAAISRESVKTFTPLPEPRNRLITINREEKIKTPEFLDAIVRILRAQPAATFAWTGCLRDVVIDEYFRREGVEDRCFFLGWVDPQCTLGRYDVFLDTYGLSGVVATQAFCGGMPTVFFRNSRAWVEMRESDLDGVNGLPRNRILAGSVDAYADNVLELINNPKIYLARVSAQRELAEKVFFNEASMYQSHIAIILSIVTESGGL